MLLACSSSSTGPHVNTCVGWSAALAQSAAYAHLLLLLLPQAARFERLFGEKYRQLGATSIQFLDFYETPHIPITGAAAHAVVLSTPSDVFVAIRWVKCHAAAVDTC